MYNSNANNAQIWYFAKDHLGSVLLMFDEEDNPSERFSFDPWGNLRNPNNWGYNNLNTGFLSYFGSRGFTGHEHLPEFGLINMNGRMYDPVIGRMLSPDNYVVDPNNGQDYNRYSYARNNPLKYTDTDDQWLHLVIGAAAARFVNKSGWMTINQLDSSWEKLFELAITIK
ncbi:MAG: RHS repeat-associated core domain-containing protein [Bacteroidales bacterium]|jgi:RHS repeat-associated protein|nr:RHS repeat-associated core domain-containing protein [Bacteroidales bacterium]